MHFFRVCCLRRTYIPQVYRCGPLKNVLLSQDQIASIQDRGASICTAAKPDEEFDLEAAIEEAEKAFPPEGGGGEEDPGTTDPEPEPEPEPEDPGVMDEAALTEAFASASGNPVIKLGADITLTAKLYARASLTLDLNGHTLDGPATAAHLLVTGTGVELNIVGPGNIRTPVQGSSNAIVTLNEGVVLNTTFTAALIASTAKVNINGATVTNDTKNAIQAQTQSTVHINSGNVVAKDYAVKVLSGSTVEVKGGTVNGSNGAIYASDTSSRGTGGIAISGGNVISASYGVVLFDDTTLNLTGGTINAVLGIVTNGSANPSNKDVKITVNGGRVDASAAGVYLPAGTLTVHNGEITGPIGIAVRGGTLVVDGGTITSKNIGSYKVGDTSYETKAAAIAVDRNSKYNGGNVDVTITGGTISASHANEKAISYTEEGQDAESPEGVKISGGVIVGEIS